MNSRLLTVLTLITTLGIVAPARAENLVHIQQLLNTRVCQRCDLTRAGFVFSNLSNVDLSNSDLSGANLTRANLRNANLRGANLSGAVMFGADLTGADLTGANLSGADMRETLMSGVTLEDTVLDGANLMGAAGLSSEIATPEQLYIWGLTENRRGNFRGAIDYYNQALSLKPDFAHALLARAFSKLQLNDPNGAVQDAQEAEQLYLTQGDERGHQISVQFYEGVLAMQEAASRGSTGGGGNFLGFLGSLSSLLLRMVLF